LVVESFDGAEELIEVIEMYTVVLRKDAVNHLVEFLDHDRHQPDTKHHEERVAESLNVGDRVEVSQPHSGEHGEAVVSQGYQGFILVLVSEVGFDEGALGLIREEGESIVAEDVPEDAEEVAECDQLDDEVAHSHDVGDEHDPLDVDLVLQHTPICLLRFYRSLNFSVVVSLHMLHEDSVIEHLQSLEDPHHFKQLQKSDLVGAEDCLHNLDEREGSQ
jgi:hypothetical protein